jgi:nucleotide-binding universal stress UspA family protein
VAPTPPVPERPRSSLPERRQAQEEFDRAGYRSLVLDPIEVPDVPSVRRIIAFGSPVDELRRLAEDHDVSLLVVGRTRPGLARAVVGSTSGALTREAPCPVLVVPAETRPESEGAIVCAFDGSQHAVAAARVALELARRLDARPVLVRVAEGTGVADADLEAVIGIGGTQARLHAVHGEGSVAEQLLAAARDRAAELLVVGTRGHGALRSALLGSVSRSVLESADRPVLVVPAPRPARR